MHLLGFCHYHGVPLFWVVQVLQSFKGVVIQVRPPASAGELPLFWDVQAMHDIGAGLEMENWIENSQPTNAEERLQVTSTHHCMQCSLRWDRVHCTGFRAPPQLSFA